MEESDIEKWEDMPYRELADAYNKVSDKVLAEGGYIGGHPIRNSYYMGDPLKIGFSEYAQKVPVLIGSVFGEMGFAPGLIGRNQMTQEELIRIVENDLVTYSVCDSGIRAGIPGKKHCRLNYI